MLAFQIKRLLTNSHQIDCRSFLAFVGSERLIRLQSRARQNLDCVNRKQWHRRNGAEMQEIVRSNKISDGQIAPCAPLSYANFGDFFFSMPLNSYKLTMCAWILDLIRTNSELKTTWVWRSHDSAIQIGNSNASIWNLNDRILDKNHQILSVLELKPLNFALNLPNLELQSPIWLLQMEPFNWELNLCNSNLSSASLGTKSTILEPKSPNLLKIWT